MSSTLLTGSKHESGDGCRSGNQCPVLKPPICYPEMFRIETGKVYAGLIHKNGKSIEGRWRSYPGNQGHGRPFKALYCAYNLVSALKSELKIPIHLHTHDTSGGRSPLSLRLQGSRCGYCGCRPGVSFRTDISAQPQYPGGNDAFPRTRYRYGLQSAGVTSDYWEVAREYYAPFESIQKSSTAEVYHHESRRPVYQPFPTGTLNGFGTPLA